MTTDDKLNAMQAVTALAAGTFIGIALTDATTAEFWLYRYQTIIAGILAIVAAAWTVYEMRRTDDRQGQRHTELVKLNLRSDSMKAARAADTFPDTLRGIALDLDATTLTIKSWRSRESLSDISNFAPTLVHLARDIGTTLKMKPITDVRDILDADASSTLESLVVRISEFQPSAMIDEIRVLGRTEERDQAIDELNSSIARLVRHVRKFAGDLERQKKVYE